MRRLAPVLVLVLAGCSRTVADMPEVRAPEGAIAFFDGSIGDWRARDGSAPRWRVEDGVLVVEPGTGDLISGREHGDGRLHVEFWLPDMRRASGQARANSGVFLHGRYEVQILDAWRNQTEPERTCAALYGVLAPGPGAVRPPRTWQTFDVTFRSPRADAAGVVTTAGRISVVHNGIGVIEDGEFERPTGTSSRLGTDIVASGPLLLQDHGAAVRFRNVWFLPSPR